MHLYLQMYSCVKHYVSTFISALFSTFFAVKRVQNITAFVSHMSSRDHEPQGLARGLAHIILIRVREISLRRSVKMVIKPSFTLLILIEMRFPVFGRATLLVLL